MTNLAQTLPLYSAEEYLKMEQNAPLRHEYVFGQIIEMAGESKIANAIILNLIELLRKSLRKQAYECYVHDVKLAVNDGEIYRYPDFMVAPVSDNQNTHIVYEPVMIIEVASDQSFRRDAVTKRKEYTQIPSLQYYIIIDQDEQYVELMQRQPHRWLTEVFSSPDAVVSLDLFEIQIQLSDIYDGI